MEVVELAARAPYANAIRSEATCEMRRGFPRSARREVDPRIGSDEQRRRDARVVDGISPLVRARGDGDEGRTGATTHGNDDPEDRPHQVLEQQAGEHRPQRRDGTPIPDHSAIDFVRWGPDQSAVIRARVVGNAIPAANPPPSRATNNTVSLGA
jgi:hypothetical protein